MYRLGNSNGGISPTTLRALFMVMIRPMFSYGAELWHNSGAPLNLAGFLTLEYQAPRNITGAYYGSSHIRLGLIAKIKPLTSRLGHISIKWAAKACRNNDPAVRQLLDISPSPGFPLSHNDTGPMCNETRITTAWSLTGVGALCTCHISYGDFTDHRTADLFQITLLNPEVEKSKQKAYLASALGKLRSDGCTLLYTDGSGRDFQVASGCYIDRSSTRAFLGNQASVADGERLGISLALTHALDNELHKICILTDNAIALNAALNLSQRSPPRSGIERDIKNALIRRIGWPTAVA